MRCNDYVPTGEHALKIQPVVLALAIIVLDLVVIIIALLMDTQRPKIVLLILNVLVLLVLYFVHASDGIRFGDEN